MSKSYRRVCKEWLNQQLHYKSQRNKYSCVYLIKHTILSDSGKYLYTVNIGYTSANYIYILKSDFLWMAKSSHTCFTDAPLSNFCATVKFTLSSFLPRLLFPLDYLVIKKNYNLNSTHKKYKYKQQPVLFFPLLFLLWNCWCYASLMYTATNWY